MRYSLQGVRTKLSCRALVKSPELEKDPARIIPSKRPVGSGRESSRIDRAKGSPADAAGIIEEARRQAAGLLAEAETEAKELRRRCQERAEALYGEWQDRGYQLGMAEGEKEIAEKIDRLARLIERAIQAREGLLSRSEPELVELAIGVAEKVVGQELTVNRTVVAAMAHRALERASTSGIYYLRVNPVDAEVVKEHLGQQLTEMRCEIVADSGIEEGGCVIVTSHGQVDAQVSSQFAEVRAALLGEGDPHSE